MRGRLISMISNQQSVCCNFVRIAVFFAYLQSEKKEGYQLKMILTKSIDTITNCDRLLWEHCIIIIYWICADCVSLSVCVEATWWIIFYILFSLPFGAFHYISLYLMHVIKIVHFEIAFLVFTHFPKEFLWNNKAYNLNVLENIKILLWIECSSSTSKRISLTHKFHSSITEYVYKLIEVRIV